MSNMKQRFQRKAEGTTATSTTTTSTDEASTDEAPTETATASPSATPAQIKVAIIKSKKLKATDENVSLVQDLMKEGGMTLDAAIKELASAT